MKMSKVLFVSVLSFVLLNLGHCKPYTSQDVDEELAESELEKQEVSYIVSRHRFNNDATPDAKKSNKKKTATRKGLPSNLDDDFFEDFDDVGDFVRFLICCRFWRCCEILKILVILHGHHVPLLGLLNFLT